MPKTVESMGMFACLAWRHSMTVPECTKSSTWREGSFFLCPRGIMELQPGRQ